MAYGKSLTLRAFDRIVFWRSIPERETRERDRSLPGKARIRARRAARQG